MTERIQLNEYLFLDELVDPVTYFTDLDHGLSKIDPRVPKLFHLLRSKYGKPIGINNWWKHLPDDLTGFNPELFLNHCISIGVYVWSGFRSEFCKIGAKGSAHRKGQAEDPKGDEKAFFKIVCDNAREFYMIGLRRVENPEFTKGWLHMDTSTNNHVPNRIRIVNPSTKDKSTSNKHAGDIDVLTGQIKMIDL